MDWVTLKEKAVGGFKKYRFALLILLVGIGLMLIPSTDQTTTQKKQTSESLPAQITVEERLEQILSKIKGAGKVSVMLTEAEGEKTVYQYDSDISEDRQKLDTVIITGGSREQTGLVQQIVAPVYLGAIIVCEGAHDPAVKLAIVEAVSDVTGLGANQISVVKMK